MKIGDEVYVHGYVDEIRSDTIIIRNEGGYFGTIPEEVNSSEKPNNSLDKGTNVLVKDCETCKHNKLEWFSEVCDGCSKAHSHYEPKTEHSGEVTEMVEPQTSCKTCRYGEVDEGYVRCAYYSKSTKQDEPQTEEAFPCDGCKWENEKWDRDNFAEHCDGCCKSDSHYEPKDEHSGEVTEMVEPQTDGYMTAEQTEDYRKMLDKAEHNIYGNIEVEPQERSE